jgi:phosphatidylglycerophosphate synthase
MPYFVIAILLLVVIVFGVSSTSQSYATAQQAKAQIETAQLGQINAWGNLITIMTMALIILVVLAILVLAVYWFFIRSKARIHARATAPRVQGSTQPTFDTGSAINQLAQVELLKLLRSMNGGVSQPVLDAPKDEEEIPWLLK